MKDIGLIEMEQRKIKIERPAVEPHKNSAVWKEVQKFVRLMPETAEPNLGRVAEIKQEIKKGTYLKPEMVDEAAARLAYRLMPPKKAAS